jgi:hypothetical protein
MYDSTQRRKPNFFEHRSDGTTIITIIRRIGEPLACVIDTVDFDLIKDRRWYADKGLYTFYAKSTYPTPVKMHQLILPEVSLIDHEDENGLNNRRGNLRDATRSLNTLNSSRKRTNGKTSIYPGGTMGNGMFSSNPPQPIASFCLVQTFCTGTVQQ